MKKTLIIAEVGENHIGDMAIAKTLIEEASRAGADYVKFQSYRPETFKKDDPEYDWFKKVSLSDAAHRMLKQHAGTCGIKFLSSPFSLERAKFLVEEIGLKEIKVASGMMLNFPVLDYLNERVETVFLSTGMATIAEVRKSFSHLNKVKRCYVLHCVTQYPCNDKDANLLAIRRLQEELPGCDIGYSDHTIGVAGPIAAVALGARVIEKHFTFDKNAKEGTDHVLSADPQELIGMVRQIRRVESMLGSSEKAPSAGEKEIIEFVRNRFV